MLFLAPNTQGQMEGMVSTIAENKPHAFLSIKHLGFIKNGVEDTQSDEIKAWAPSFENYTLKEANGGTELSVDMDTTEQYHQYFEQTWPLALQRLKEIVETGRSTTVTVGTTVRAPREKVWECWTEPSHIVKWCHASEDWEAPHADNDVRVGGKFKTVMAAKDGSTRFDFEGVYTKVKQYELIEYVINDGRRVNVQFTSLPDSIQLTETFEMEKIHPEQVQRAGWQAILDHFQIYTERNR
jgi:uncharacterized protein YndB with AHSA1/START domain